MSAQTGTSWQESEEQVENVYVTMTATVSVVQPDKMGLEVRLGKAKLTLYLSKH